MSTRRCKYTATLSRQEGAGGFAANGTSEVASGAIIWLLLAHSSSQKGCGRPVKSGDDTEID